VWISSGTAITVNQSTARNFKIASEIKLRERHFAFNIVGRSPPARESFRSWTLRVGCLFFKFSLQPLSVLTL
jgi:hypothetical protein